MPDSPMCDRCGFAKSLHTDVQLFCPFISTFRAAGPPAATPGQREAALREAAKAACWLCADGVPLDPAGGAGHWREPFPGEKQSLGTHPVFESCASARIWELLAAAPPRAPGDALEEAGDLRKGGEMWLEFLSHQLCGLCGNTGWIDTRQTAVSPAGIWCGVRRHCICPNGRALAVPPSVSGGEPGVSEVERLAAMLLCKTGDAEDPRFADVKPVPIWDLPRVPATFKGKSAPLTDQQVRDVLAGYFAVRAARPSPEGSTET